MNDTVWASTVAELPRTSTVSSATAAANAMRFPRAPAAGATENADATHRRSIAVFGDLAFIETPTGRIAAESTPKPAAAVNKILGTELPHLPKWKASGLLTPLTLKHCRILAFLFRLARLLCQLVLPLRWGGTVEDFS